MFTKRHYKAIAEIIKNNTCTALPEPNHDTLIRIDAHKEAGIWIALNLADYFAEDNPRFDRQRFLAACGIK